MKHFREVDQTPIPISSFSLHILIALAAGPCPGYSIAGRVIAATLGGAAIGKSTIYATLRRLTEQGLLEGDDPIVSHAGRMIICYSLTPEGWDTLRCEERRLKILHQSLRERLIEYDCFATNVI